MKNTKNIHANTLNAEAEAKLTAEELAAEEARIAEITAREEAHEGEALKDVFETVELITKGSIIVVKIKTTDDPEGMEIGAASSEEDAQKMIDDLRPYAPEGKLLTKRDVLDAMFKRMTCEKTALGIIEAGEKPERKIMVDGEEFFVTSGTEIRRVKDSKLVLELKSLPRLADEDIEELVAPAIREAIAKINEEENFYYADENTF